eukprot:scaffold96124_cov69-Phaeocystis_antarctica.AAC.1
MVFTIVWQQLCGVRSFHGPTAAGLLYTESVGAFCVGHKDSLRVGPTVWVLEDYFTQNYTAHNTQPTSILPCSSLLPVLIDHCSPSPPPVTRIHTSMSTPSVSRCTHR